MTPVFNENFCKKHRTNSDEISVNESRHSEEVYTPLYSSKNDLEKKRKCFVYNTR